MIAEHSDIFTDQGFSEKGPSLIQLVDLREADAQAFVVVEPEQLVAPTPDQALVM